MKKKFDLESVVGIRYGTTKKEIYFDLGFFFSRQKLSNKVIEELNTTVHNNNYEYGSESSWVNQR